MEDSQDDVGDIDISVIVPTRNRPESIRRLLSSIGRQTLAKNRFEVIVVDDGSQPPIPRSVGAGIDIDLRIVFRDRDHGAHAARREGLRAARGRRVLLLDDDVVADPELLAAHADTGLADGLALGPILYPLLDGASPYYRYMAAFYQRCLENYQREGGGPELGDYYVCNSSGLRRDFIHAFDLVTDKFPRAIAGGGFDEILLAHAHASQGRVATLVARAMLWHEDTKTLGQALREARIVGAASGRMVLDGELVHAIRQFRLAIMARSPRGVLRRMAMRQYWTLPWPFEFVSTLLASLAEQKANALVPAWVCHVPIRLAHWEGLRSVMPSFDTCLDALNDERWG